MGGGFFVAYSGHGEHEEGHVTTFVVVACIVAAMGGLLFGYDIGISGGVTSMEEFLKRSFQTWFVKCKTKQGVKQSTANTKRASHSLHLLPLPRSCICFFPRFNRNKALRSESLDDLWRSRFSLRSSSVVTSDPTTVILEMQLSSSSSYSTSTLASSLLCEETASSTVDENGDGISVSWDKDQIRGVSTVSRHVGSF